jgi:hypothetical protein
VGSGGGSRFGSWQCSGWLSGGEQGRGEEAREVPAAGGHEGAEHGEHEDVERDERAEASVEPGRDGEGGEDEGELASSEDGESDVGGGDAAEVLDAGGDDAGGDVEDDGEDHSRRDGNRDVAGVAWVDGEPEREEERGGERVSQWEDEAFDPVGNGALGEDEAGHERADGGGHAKLLGDSRNEDGEAHEADGEELVVGAGDEPSHGRRSPPSARTEGEQEPERGRELRGGLGCPLGVTEDRLEEREVQGEEDVLDDDDAEDEAALGVGQPMELGEELGDDRLG